MFGFSAFSQAPFSTLGGANVFTASVSESVQVSDVNTATSERFASLSESINLSSTFVATADYIGDFADSVLFVDTISSDRFVHADIDEDVQFDAVNNADRFAYGDVAEQINFSSTEAVLLDALGSVSESVIVNDAVDRAYFTNVDVFEPIHVSGVFTGGFQNLADFNDSIELYEFNIATFFPIVLFFL